MTPPEGNAHQAEFSHDNQFILAADEDFDAVPLRGHVDPARQRRLRFRSARPRADEGPLVRTRDPVTGDTRFVGQACTAAAIPPATEGVTIARRRASATAPSRYKTENAEAAATAMIMFIFSNADGANARVRRAAATSELHELHGRHPHAVGGAAASASG